MKGNDRNVFENTLLILESPTVAKIIEDFNLPYLNIIATKGFCWKPLYNRSKNKLKLSAIDGKREIRNKIRDESRWATQVVVATDTDAAGDLIAYSIFKHLKRFDINLKRTNLGGLSSKGIQNSIQSARPLSPQSLTRRLKNRYKWSHILRNHTFPGDIPHTFKHAILATCAFFYGNISFNRFRDPAGNMYIADEAVRMIYGENVSVQKDSTAYYHRQWYPPNTSDILTLMVEKLEYTSYESAQQDLNHLFTRVPDNLYTGLISYPRTKNRAFYPSTWDGFENQWVKTKSLESLIPRQFRPTTFESAVHEAIHPLRLDYAPRDIRPFVRKKYFDIYRLIYEHHLKVLKRPERYETTRLNGVQSQNSFYLLSPGESIPQKKFHLEPVLQLSDLLYLLLNYKVIRPSKLGKFIDFSLTQAYLEMDSDSIARPGNALESFSAAINDFSQLNKLLRIVKQQLDTTIEAKMISHKLTSILNM